MCDWRAVLLLLSDDTLLQSDRMCRVLYVNNNATTSLGHVSKVVRKSLSEIQRIIYRIDGRICHSSVVREWLSVHAANMTGSTADVAGGKPLESCGSHSAADVSAALMSAVGAPVATNPPLLTTIATSPMNKLP